MRLRLSAAITPAPQAASITVESRRTASPALAETCRKRSCRRDATATIVPGSGFASGRNAERLAGDSHQRSLPAPARCEPMSNLGRHRYAANIEPLDDNRPLNRFGRLAYTRPPCPERSARPARTRHSPLRSADAQAGRSGRCRYETRELLSRRQLICAAVSGPDGRTGRRRLIASARAISAPDIAARKRGPSAFPWVPQAVQSRPRRRTIAAAGSCRGFPILISGTRPLLPLPVRPLSANGEWRVRAGASGSFPDTGGRV